MWTRNEYLHVWRNHYEKLLIQNSDEILQDGDEASDSCASENHMRGHDLPQVLKNSINEHSYEDELVTIVLYY